MLGIRCRGVRVALGVNLELAQCVGVGVGVLVEYPLRRMVKLVSVYVILCVRCLITGRGSTVASYRISIMCSRLMSVNLILGCLGRITRRLVSTITTAPTFRMVGLVVVNVLLGSRRRSPSRGIDRSALGDYDGRDYAKRVFKVDA